MKRLSRILSSLLACATVLLGAPAQADDSEVFTNSAFLATGVQPNVLFIIDTSGSMTTLVNVFDASKTYTGACPAGRIYWSTVDTKEPPDCASDQWISEDNNRCRTGFNGIAKSGWWRGRTMMLLKQDNKGAALSPTKWGSFVAGKDWKIECRSDVGNHGDDPGSSAAVKADKLPKNGTTGTADSDRWGSQTCVTKKGKTTCTDPAGVLTDTDWNANYYSLYSSSYANWYASTEDGVLKSRFEIVSEVATDMIDSLTGVNLGLMRYSTSNGAAEGGMITYPVSPLTDASRTTMKTQLATIYKPDGYTPLSETLYEAYLYMTGSKPKFGDTSTISDGPDLDDKDDLFPSVPGARVDGVAKGIYDSPMDYSCQTTYIVYLTDGLPTQDNSADTAIEALGATCPAQIDDPDKDWPKSGRCLENMARYMANNDLRKDVVGDQKVVTYFIGFGDDVAKSKAFLEKVAAAGGGKAYTQNDAAGLKATLEEIFAQVQTGADTTFVAPAVAVNAFNRSQNLNELFVSVFAPSANLHWPGNLKKYRILNRAIYGTDASTPAVDKKTGFFSDGSQALNTIGGPDGPKTTKGGAAADLEDTSTSARKIYTYLGTSTDLTAAENAVKPENDKITAADVGAIDADDRTRILQFARGHDINDEDKTSDFHHHMGDPMHARPAILIHGGTEDKPKGTVFVPTNDGVLHAFDMANIPEPDDPVTSLSPATTAERWAFIPKDFLLRQNDLFKNAPTTTRRYALDGDVRVLKLDVNQNGVLDPGDKAYIFFGTGRGGRAYYAIDVTNIDKPVFMWKIDSLTSGFGNLGRTWSAPQIGRVKVGTGAGQNKEQFVLLFGGGYDTRNDTAPAVATDFVYGTDSSGNSLYMVDAVSGALLWSAGKSATTYNFTSAKMTHSFPANLTVLDTDADKFLDRIYAADVDGKIWRFDISNGKGADSLVTGGVLASLGNSMRTTKDAANARRFYSAPDVSSIAIRGSVPYFNIAIGSGYRGHPLNKDTEDRFYSVRDYDPYNTRTQASYTDDAVVEDGELVDITDMSKAPTSKDPGWKLTLNNPSWRGEKAISESTTAAGEILFTTYTPLGEDTKNPCLARSLNRAYIVNVTDGKPFTRMTESGTGPLKPEDRFSDLLQSGIAPTPQVLADPQGGSMGLCQIGATILGHCVNFGSAIRSYWEHK